MAPISPLPLSHTRALLAAAASNLNLHPSRTLPHLLHALSPRQTQTTTGPAATVTVLNSGGGGNNANGNTDNNAPNGNPDPTSTTGLTGGAIAGIVIGSIAGFLLLVWIIRSCTNLGAPPGEEAVPGRPWYGGVRDEYEGPPARASRRRSRDGRGRSPGPSPRRSRSRNEDGGYYYREGSGRARSGSRRMSVAEVQEVAPVVVREGRRSYGYGEGGVRGSRSRSRGGY